MTFSISKLFKSHSEHLNCGCHWHFVRGGSIVWNCQRHCRTFRVLGLCPIDVKKSPLSPAIVTIQTPSLISIHLGLHANLTLKMPLELSAGGWRWGWAGGTQWRRHYCLGEALYTVPSHSVLSTEACQRIPLNPHCFCKEKGMLFTEHSASPNLTVVNKMGAKERSIHGFEPASSCQSQCPVWAMQRLKVPARSQERNHPRQQQL